MISKKVFKNTMILYFRQVLLLLVSLYTVRVVLETLGIEDYGIYSVVAGIVTLCSFLSGSMASATQRFFSFAIGKKDEKLLNTTFTVNIVIYFIIGVVVLVLLEGPGLWFVSNELNVPAERVNAAHFLYQCSVATFFFTVLTSPFIAIIISHEDMEYFAFISIAEAIIKLVAVFALVHLPGEKLEVYGILLLVISIFIMLCYASLCFKKYAECQLTIFYWDSMLLKEMLSFTGWSLFGQLSTAARFQAVTILINQFFNPSVAAARAIAITISSKINIFSNNFNTGLYPSIVKSYANKNNDEMFSLICNGSKLTFFLMWVFALPLLIEMEAVLTIWLTELPEQVVLFAKLALVESLVLSISLPIATAARAPGKMKGYELTLGVLQLSIFAIAYFVLHLGFPAYSVFIVAIFMNVVMFFARLKLVSGLIGLPQLLFIKQACLPISALILISSLFAYGAHSILPSGIFYSFINIFCCVFVSSVTMFYVGLDKIWRKKVLALINKKLFKKEVIQ